MNKIQMNLQLFTLHDFAGKAQGDTKHSNTKKRTIYV
jgi:hypothetical protein